MADLEREHPDEGTIHAWLDGALDDASARALASHVATCRECAERVAEARGLIAGASRVVSALDDTPATTGPAWGQTPPAATPPARRWLRVTPGRAAIAATILVALGVALTYKRTAVESQAMRDSAPLATTPSAAPVRDTVLDSAVARNLAIAQPRRTLEPARSPAVPVPPPAPVPANVVADRAAAQKVATARAELRAERAPSAAAAADQLPSRAADVRRADAEKVVAAAAKADSAAGGASSVVLRAPAEAPAGGVTRSRVMAMSPPAECYRVESANGTAATWATVALPFVVRLDSAGRSAAVLGTAGETTGSSAVVGRRGEDSLLLDLRRIGYSGTLALGTTGEDAWAGVMRSRALETHLSEVVTTATPSAKESRAARRAPVAKAAPPAAPAEAAAGLNAAPAVPVVARRIACP